MPYRASKGSEVDLVKFANAKFSQPNSLKQDLVKAFGQGRAGYLWKTDQKTHRLEHVKDLQRTLVGYLRALVRPEIPDNSEDTPLYADDVLAELEKFGETEHFRFEVMSVEEGKPLYLRLEGGTPIRLRNSTAKLAIIPTYGSLRQLIYTSLAKVLDDGSFAKIGKCIEPSCRKFFLAKRKGRKHFCGDRCRWDYNNNTQNHRDVNRESQKTRRKNIKSSKIVNEKTPWEIFEAFLKHCDLAKHESEAMIDVFRKIGGGSIMPSRQDTRQLIELWRGGDSAEKLWQRFPSHQQRVVEDALRTWIKLTAQ